MMEKPKIAGGRVAQFFLIFLFDKQMMALVEVSIISE